MALKVELKPGERIIIGEAVITNGDSRTRLLIDGEVPILREKDILTNQTANTPARRIYLAVQLMYLENDVSKYKDIFFDLVKELVSAAPSTIPHVEAISKEILTNSLYKALKAAKQLVVYEGDLLDHASRYASLREDGADNRQSA